MSVTKTFVLLFLISVSFVFSDTLILKNNEVYENVKVRTDKEFLEVQSEDGTRKRVSKKFVKNLKLRVVIWKQTASMIDTYEQERIRIAEFLIENSNWQPKEGEKPQLMILKFRAGKGILPAKAESLSNLIRTKIINTGVFVIVDRLTMEKEIEKNKCTNINCSQDIADQLKVNKLLTGEISLTPNGYFITGEVIDIKKRKVEFSETILIPSDDKEEENSGIFAKKIAGGTLNQWEHPINNPQAGTPITPYIWRSIIIPGWGQYEKEQLFRAFLYPIILAAGGFYYKANIDQYNERLNQYGTWSKFSFLDQTRTSNPYLFYFSEIEKTEANRKGANANRIASFLVGVYIINLLDVIFTQVPMELKNISFDYNKEMNYEKKLISQTYEIFYTIQF